MYKNIVDTSSSHQTHKNRHSHPQSSCRTGGQRHHSLGGPTHGFSRARQQLIYNHQVPEHAEVQSVGVSVAGFSKAFAQQIDLTAENGKVHDSIGSIADRNKCQPHFAYIAF